MDILIVDDHPIVQRGLKLLLETEKGWRVVGLAADGASATHFAAELRPEITIVDLSLPDSNGLDVAADIKHISPATKVIILSMHMNEFYLRAARRQGASAYVSKHVAESEIVNAVKMVLAGRTYPEQFGDESADAATSTAVKKVPDVAAVLTVREVQVLQILASGCQNKDVAQRLNISVRTVEKHRGNIMRKLKLKNQVELVHFALQYDLLDLPKQLPKD